MANKKSLAEKQVKYWLMHAKEDLKSAKIMLESKRYSWCAFICQQALEKLLKAGYVAKYERIPPYIHKLERLLQILKLAPPTQILNTIILVDKYYIVARYPVYKASVEIKNKRTAEDIYTMTRRAFRWLAKELQL